MRAEGWYVDPFGVHTDRWFSDGQPTSLVRDGERESHDEPPSDKVPERLERSRRAAGGDSSDLNRADDAARGERSFTARDQVDAAQSQFYFPPWPS